MKEELKLKEFKTSVSEKEYAIYFLGEHREIKMLIQRVGTMPNYETPEGIPVMHIIDSNAKSLIDKYGFLPDENLIEVIGETTESAARLAYTVSCGTC